MFFNGVWNDNNHNTVLDCDTIIYFQEQWAKEQSMKQFMISTRARIKKEHMRLVTILIFALGITILLHLLLILIKKGKHCIPTQTRTMDTIRVRWEIPRVFSHTPIRVFPP